MDGGGFKEGSTLVSNEIEATTEAWAEVLEIIADQDYDKEANVYIFDIHVAKDGEKVQPNGKVKVSVPIPNVEITDYLVFHIKADNSVETLVPTVADGKISFEVSSLSRFMGIHCMSLKYAHSLNPAISLPVIPITAITQEWQP